MSVIAPERKTRNPAHTTLKTVGRQHRDEPFHLVYRVVLYPKRDKLSAEALGDWCALRYLDDKRKVRRTAWRIETYLHRSGKRYVNRVLLERLSEEEQIELKLKFGKFVDKKVIREGLVRRPRLNSDEKAIRDAWLDSFYMDISQRRLKAVEEERARQTQLAL